jgi:hypothetical protein
MICQLCGQDRKLIDAHVIPRSFHRLDSKDPTPAKLVTNVEGRYPQKIRKGVYDQEILCEQCERRFSPWDNYGAQLFIKDWPNFAPIMNGAEQVGYELPTYDYPLLKLFFLSVLWRAAVSTHVMYSKIDLGPREAALKQSILSGDPGNADHFGVVLQGFDVANVGFLDPQLERLCNLRFARFYLSHVIAFIKVDSQPFDEPLKSLCLGAQTSLTVLMKPFMTSPERRVMRNLAFGRS